MQEHGEQQVLTPDPTTEARRSWCGPARSSGSPARWRFVLAAGLTMVVLQATADVRPVPEPVSPAATGGEALVEARCPAFSWAGIEGAQGYELVVLAVVDEGADGAREPRIASRASVSAGARSWTPSLGECLERGGRYAWSVRASLPTGEGAWSAPAVFRIDPGPRAAEVEAAIAPLHRARQEGGAADSSADDAGRAGVRRPGDARPTRTPSRLPLAREGAAPVVAAAAAPVLGSPSLNISSNIALGAESNVFKDGFVFLWSNTSDNTALGRLALRLATAEASDNSAVGARALFFNTSGSANTALGADALSRNTTGEENTATGSAALFFNDTGNRNTAVGSEALLWNTTGSQNTASGTGALYRNQIGDNNVALGSKALLLTLGSHNTAVGTAALLQNNAGNRNVAVGFSAGFNVSGSPRDDNIFISNEGEKDDDRVIRIGTQGTQTGGTYVAGIYERVVTGGRTVKVDADGKLGIELTVSSARFKEEIADLGEVGERLAELRPVTFRYRSGLADGETDAPQVGLIAEEVAELFPELVTRDPERSPYGVRYDLLSVLLLDEVQKLRERVGVLEAGEPPVRRKRPWRRGAASGGRESP